MPARLIINADDFGLSPGVNRAIGELAQAGAISSATLMAGGACFDDAVTIAKAQPTLGVGCHLVFVDGRPLSPARDVISLLAGDGTCFKRSLVSFAQAAMRGRIRTEEIELETVAQISRLQAAGIEVTHVDTHKHTHAFPAVMRGVLRGAAQCGVVRYRFPFEPGWSQQASRGVTTLKRVVQLGAMQRMEAAFVNEARDRGVTTSGTLGILATGAMSRELMQSLNAGLTALEDDSVLELCVHPGHVDEALRELSTRLLGSRETEYQALLELAQARCSGDLLTHYGQLESSR